MGVLFISGHFGGHLEAGSSWLLPRDPHSDEPGSPLARSLWCPGSRVCGSRVPSALPVCIFWL